MTDPRRSARTASAAALLGLTLLAAGALVLIGARLAVTGTAAAAGPRLVPVEGWIELLLLTVGAAVALWMLAGAAVGTFCVLLVRGRRAGARLDAALGTWAPVVVRRLARGAVGVGVGAGLVLSPVAANAAETPPQADEPAVVLDLGWQPTATDTRATPATGPAAAADRAPTIAPVETPTTERPRADAPGPAADPEVPRAGLSAEPSGGRDADRRDGGHEATRPDDGSRPSPADAPTASPGTSGAPAPSTSAPADGTALPTGQFSSAGPAAASAAGPQGGTGDAVDDRAVRDPAPDARGATEHQVPAARTGPGESAGSPRGTTHDDVTEQAAGGAAHRAADEVVVVRGDTLWEIAARHLPADATDGEVLRAMLRWHDANRDVVGDDPDVVLPGQVLRAP